MALPVRMTSFFSIARLSSIGFLNCSAEVYLSGMVNTDNQPGMVQPVQLELLSLIAITAEYMEPCWSPGGFAC